MSATGGSWALSAALAVATLAVLCLVERRLSIINFGALCLLWIVAVATLATGDLNDALLISLYLVVVIGMASQIKYAYVRQTLALRDLRHIVAANWTFLRRRYAAETGLLFGTWFVLTAMLLAGLVSVPPSPVPLAVAIVFAALATLVLLARDSWRSRRRPNAIHLSADQRHFSNFVSSIFHNFGPTGRFQMVDVAIAAAPLALGPATLAEATDRPDIVLILHESTFDPRLYGFDVNDSVSHFLTPEDGLSGPLHVDVFGGKTWQSEFSILTGLSSRSFGANSEYVFQLAPGRVRHSLPHFMRSLGYRTMIFGCDRAETVNMGSFYSDIGFEECRFPAEWAGPDGTGPRPVPTETDDPVYTAALDHWCQAAASSPCFIVINTMTNHGPHRRAKWSANLHRDERRAAFARSGDRAFAEYYVRLVECAGAYKRFREAAGAVLGDRSAVFVRYGDHQPPLCSRLARRHVLPPEKLFETFYAIESQNHRLRPAAVGAGALLDIAFLPTVGLQAAGLPLDDFYATHASLIEECRGGYFSADSERKREFHRALIDARLVLVND